MSIGLIAWGRFFDANGNKITVPAPSTEKDVPWLADFVAENAQAISQSFDFVQWPPLNKVQGGAGPGCDGYGVFDRRDLGSKNQQGSVPTRYGSCESILRAIAVLNSNGVGSYLDIVLHQLIGENGGPGVFHYVGADGKTLNGRGGAKPGWFRGGTGNNDPVPPFCKEDAVPNSYYDYPFGREVSYQNCSPSRVTIHDALDYGDWLFRRTGAYGARFDDVKGMWSSAVSEFMYSRSMASKPFYAEYFDGDPGALNWWITSSPMSGRSAVEDFTLHWRIQAACNGFDATQFANDGMGFWQWNSGLSYGFVDNPDTDTSPGQQVVSNKLLAYAYLLTLPVKAALVYGKDYFPSSVWPGAYGLKPWLDNLCWISRTFAFGNLLTRWLDDKVIVLNRDGDGGEYGWSGGLLTCINFDTWNARTITCQTSFGANRQLHDYTGHHEDIWTDGEGRATFTIPSNAYSGGQSYLCFAPAGVTEPITLGSHETTQTFFGAADLDIPPAKTETLVLPQRIWCAKDKPISVAITADHDGWGESSNIQVQVESSDGEHAISCTLNNLKSANNSGSAKGEGKTSADGWHTIRLIGSQLPDAGSEYQLTISYSAMKTI